MSKVTNKEARDRVLRKKVFCNNNDTMWGVWDGGRYVVYSYGHHHIMWVFDPGVELWFGNVAWREKEVTRTTARHHSLTKPPTVNHWVDQWVLEQIRNIGWVELLARRMAPDTPHIFTGVT